VGLGTPRAEWRARYRGWKALEKLEYVDALLAEVKDQPAPRPQRKVRRISEASRLRKTLERYYAERRKHYAEDFPDFYDADLRAIFSASEPGEESAARLVRRLMLRCESLGLVAPRNEARALLELSAYLSTLVTNHLHTGRFKRSV
jgi:hypothetical protein